MPPTAAFTRYPSARWVSSSDQASPVASRLAGTSGRIDFVSCGLVSHLRVLSTPPLGDAVPFGFQAGERMPGKDFHLHTCALAGALAPGFNLGREAGTALPFWDCRSARSKAPSLPPQVETG